MIVQRGAVHLQAPVCLGNRGQLLSIALELYSLMPVVDREMSYVKVGVRERLHMPSERLRALAVTCFVLHACSWPCPARTNKTMLLYEYLDLWTADGGGAVDPPYGSV